MALQSKLFRGDAKLEAAAVSDPAHILPGSTGPHVAKIQRALILLDDAKISEDSVYGPATAAAVLAYKQKRNIINRSYQTKADNIVGKMTIASLDGEMLATEVVPAGPPRLTPIFPMQRPSPSRPLPQSASHLLLGFNAPPLDALPTIPPPSLTLTPSTLEVKPNEIGLIRVDNGRGKELVCVNPSIATIAPLDLPPNAHTLTRVKITQDPQFFRVFAKGSPGRTSITVSPSSLFFDPFMTVIVLAEVKVFFHFLGGPAGIATTRKRSDLAAIVQTMNNIYQREHSGFVFTNVGFNPSLAVAGVGGGLVVGGRSGVRVNEFSPFGLLDTDLKRIDLNQNAAFLFNVFFVGRFLDVTNPGGPTNDLLALTSRPPSDTPPLRCCVCRDPDPADPPGIDPGKTLAHEAGHALGEDDDQQDNSSLMFFSQSRGTDTKISLAMAARMLSSFKQFPP